MGNIVPDKPEDSEVVAPHLQMMRAGYDPLARSMELTNVVDGMFKCQLDDYHEAREERKAAQAAARLNPDVHIPPPPMPPLATASVIHKMIEAQLKLAAPSAKPIDLLTIGDREIHINVVNFNNLPERSKNNNPAFDAVVDIPNEQ